MKFLLEHLNIARVFFYMFMLGLHVTLKLLLLYLKCVDESFGTLLLSLKCVDESFEMCR
jgi:hypothetical protein